MIVIRFTLALIVHQFEGIRQLLEGKKLKWAEKSRRFLTLFDGKSPISTDASLDRRIILQYSRVFCEGI